MKIVPRAPRSRLAGLVAVASLIGAALIASLAFAHTYAYPNQVTLSKARPLGGAIAVYKGRVLSGKLRCKVAREVQIFHATPNPDIRVARGYSHAGGYWKVKGARVPNGNKVYALIETKVLAQNPNHDHTCLVDRSTNRKFPYP
jgi:hypothetical protein